MEHQDRVGGALFIEEHGSFYRFIAKKSGAAISLHPNAWRALGGYKQACMCRMRDSHDKSIKRQGGRGKGTGKGKGGNGKKYNTRRRKVKIDEEPEEA